MRKTQIPHEWYPRALPENIELSDNVYLESSYGFTRFLSQQTPALTMGEASGLYEFNGAIITGADAVIRVGAYTCLNNCLLIANDRIEIGAFCLVAWRVVITDSLVPGSDEASERGHAMRCVAADPARSFPSLAETAPVKIEDNVWIGFDSVICGGVTIGRGAIIGCKTVITGDVPAYAIVAGNPPRVIRYLEPDDTDDVRAAAVATFTQAAAAK